MVARITVIDAHAMWVQKRFGGHRFKTFAKGERLKSSKLLFDTEIQDDRVHMHPQAQSLAPALD